MAEIRLVMPERSADEFITTLSPTDVLLGRGTGFNEYRGNRSFRTIVEEFKASYAATEEPRIKAMIVKQVFAKINSVNGRFLKLVDSQKQKSGVVEDGTWIEVSEKAALDKIKRALREPQSESPHHGREINVSTANYHHGLEQINSVALSASFPAAGIATSGLRSSFPYSTSPIGHNAFTFPSVQPPITQSLNEGLAPMHLFGATEALQSALIAEQSRSIAQARLLLFPQSLNTSRPVGDGSGLGGVDALLSFKRDRPKAQTHSVAPREHHSSDNVAGIQSRATKIARTGGHNKSDRLLSPVTCLSTANDEMMQSTETVEDDDVKDFLLSIMAISNKPIITQQEVEKEKEALTDEEQAAMLVDVFGRKCNIDLPKRKRPRFDLDPNSIAFLLRQMRCEVERIPQR